MNHLIAIIERRTTSKIVFIVSLSVFILLFVLIVLKVKERRELTSSSIRIRIYTLTAEKVLFGRVASHRGYLLSGNKNYKVQYDEANAGIEKVIAMLRKEAQSDQLQNNRLDSLLKLHAIGLVYTNENISLLDQGKVDEAINTFRSGKGQALLDSGRNILERFSAEEHRKADVRLQSLKQTEKVYLALQLLLLVCLIVISIQFLRSKFKEAKTHGELRTKEQQYQFLQNTLQHASITTDGEGQILGINHQASSLLKDIYPVNVNENLNDLLPPGTYPKHISAANANESEKGAYTQTVILRTKSGQRRFIEVTTSLLHVEAGKTNGAIHFIRDTTAEVHAKLDLKAWNRSLVWKMQMLVRENREQLNEVQEAIIKFGSDWECQFLNRLAATLPLLQEGAREGCSINTLLRPAFRSQIHAHMLLTAFHQKNRNFHITDSESNQNYYCRAYPKQMGVDLYIMPVV